MVAGVPELWSSRSMNGQPKSMIGILATGLLLVLVSGCGTGRYGAAGDWQWTPPARLAAGNAGSSGAVIVSPVQADAQYFAYAPRSAPEYDRRDGSLNIRTNDPTAGWMGWPEHQRPSLDHYRTFYASPNANRYNYPSVPSGNGYDRRPRYRSHRRY